LKFPVHKIQYLISEICSYCNLVYVDEDTIDKTLAIYLKYGFSYSKLKKFLWQKQASAANKGILSP
jgi:phosphoribosyl-AMP cyclohydrolase